MSASRNYHVDGLIKLCLTRLIGSHTHQVACHGRTALWVGSRTQSLAMEQLRLHANLAPMDLYIFCRCRSDWKVTVFWLFQV